MNKVPLLATIGSACAFAFGNLATIAGLIWLPTALMLTIRFYAATNYLSVLALALADGNLYELGRADGLRYLAWIVALLLQAVAAAPVMCQALELRRGRAFIGFHLGMTSLRVFGATAAFAIVFLVIEYLMGFVLVLATIAVVFSAKAFGVAGTLPGELIAGAAILAAVALFVLLLSYCAIRLSFFLVAIAVAERKIDLIRSWRLFDRNFLRVSLILFAISLPLLVVHGAMLWAALGFPGFPSVPPTVLIQMKTAPTRLMAEFVRMGMARMPVIYAVDFVLAPLWVGLTTGAAAAAYRFLVQPGESGMKEATMFPAAPEASPA